MVCPAWAMASFPDSPPAPDQRQESNRRSGIVFLTAPKTGEDARPHGGNSLFALGDAATRVFNLGIEQQNHRVAILTDVAGCADSDIMMP